MRVETPSERFIDGTVGIEADLPRRQPGKLARAQARIDHGNQDGSRLVIQAFQCAGAQKMLVDLRAREG